MLQSFLQEIHYYDLIHFLKSHSILFSKYYSTLSLRKQSKKNTIIIYSMGAVGSTGMSNSLTNQLDDYFVFDIKWLDKNNLDLDRKFGAFFYKKNKKEGISTELLPDYLKHGYFLRNRLKQFQKLESPTKIVTITRDPVARNVSSFFQNLKKYYRYDIATRLTEVGMDRVVKELSALFVYRYLDKNGISFFDSDPLTWFDEELKQHTAIDLYEKEFSHQKGFSIYEKDNINLLVLRYEDVESCLEKATKQFLGQEVKFCKQFIVDDEKSSVEVYKRFIQEVKIPDYYIDEIYHSRYAQHFYTEEEISLFKNEWINNSIEKRGLNAKLY